MRAKIILHFIVVTKHLLWPQPKCTSVTGRESQRLDLFILKSSYHADGLQIIQSCDIWADFRIWRRWLWRWNKLWSITWLTILHFRRRWWRWIWRLKRRLQDDVLIDFVWRVEECLQSTSLSFILKNLRPIQLQVKTYSTDTVVFRLHYKVSLHYNLGNYFPMTKVTMGFLMSCCLLVTAIQLVTDPITCDVKVLTYQA